MPQYPDQNNESFINRNYMGEILIIQLEHAILELVSSKHYQKSQKLNNSTKHAHQCHADVQVVSDTLL